MALGSLKGLQLSVADIEAAHERLRANGVPVSAIQHHDGTGFVDGKGEDWNSFFFFDDPDGNGWAVQESPTMRAKATGA
jgi:catechol 2,3-dioxygenase-like lactoylglutathione lyase family enzyme